MTSPIRIGGVCLCLALLGFLLFLIVAPDSPVGLPSAPPLHERDAGPAAVQEIDPSGTHPERAALPGGPARLRIQVVDPEGLPVAGVPVGLARPAGQRLDMRWSGRTAGEEGLVEVAGPTAERLGPGPLLALLLLPLGSLVQEEVDPDSPPPVPVRLRLPPTGQVRVRLEMEGVGPVPAEASLWIGYLIAGEPGPLEGIHHPTLRQHLKPGQTEWLVPWIGLGLDLEVHARSGSWITAQQKGKGPTLPGETTKDPRLQGIDLRGRLEPIEVALIFPGGSIPKDIQILCGPAFRPFEMRDVQLQSTGVFRYAIGKEPIDFIVATDAYPPHLIRGIAHDCRIVIDHGLEVLLSLTPGAVVPEPPMGLMALLCPEGASATPAILRSSRVPVAPFSPAGEARVRVAGPGSFELGLRILRKGRPGREVKVSPARVVVEDGQAVILVTPDPESLAAAMEPIAGPR